MFPIQVSVSKGGDDPETSIPETEDDPTAETVLPERPVATAARVGWLLAEAYRAVRVEGASDLEPTGPIAEEELLSRCVLPPGAVDRTRTALINALLVDLRRHFAPPGLPHALLLGAEGPPTRQQVLDIDAEVRSWLLLSVVPDAQGAYLVGRALSDLNGRRAPEEIAPLLATVRGLGPALGDGVAQALADSVKGWSEASGEPTRSQERAVRRQWQELLFGSATVSDDEEGELLADVASEMRGLFVLGVIVSLIAGALCVSAVVYALAGDGSVWQRVGVGLIGAGTAAAALAGGVGRSLGAMWRGFLRRHVQALRIRSSYELRLQRALDSNDVTLDDVR